MKVYAKAKWYFESEGYPQDVPIERAYVQFGFILAWLVEKNLVSAEFMDDFGTEAEQVRSRQMTGPRLWQITDGVLASDMAKGRANKFLSNYFNTKRDINVFADYEQLFQVSNLTELFQVEDSWSNYDKFREVLDSRYADWEKENPVKSKGKP